MTNHFIFSSFVNYVNHFYTIYLAT